MPRRYRKRIINRDKYSIEQTNFITPTSIEWPVVTAPSELQQDSYQYSIQIIPASTDQGMRKIKHLTISMANYRGTSDSASLFYAIVYVPQGYQPQHITVPASGAAGSNYQANQYIMSSGVIDFSAGPTRIYSRLSRNLNSGDAIYLLLATPFGTQDAWMAQVSYAVTLQ